LNIKGASAIFRSSAGQALVEAALIAPLLVLLVVGVYEFSRAIQANNIIANMSREMANLASRTTTAPADVMSAVALTSQPLNMTGNGMMYITVVTDETNSNGVSLGKAKVTSQYSWGSNPQWASKIGASGNTANLSMFPKYPLSNGNTAYIAEVYYNYQFGLSSILKYSPVMYSMSIF